MPWASISRRAARRSGAALGVDRPERACAAAELATMWSCVRTRAHARRRSRRSPGVARSRFSGPLARRGSRRGNTRRRPDGMMALAALSTDRLDVSAPRAWAPRRTSATWLSEFASRSPSRTSRPPGRRPGCSPIEDGTAALVSTSSATCIGLTGRHRRIARLAVLVTLKSGAETLTAPPCLSVTIATCYSRGSLCGRAASNRSQGDDGAAGLQHPTRHEAWKRHGRPLIRSIPRRCRAMTWRARAYQRTS